MRKFINKLKKVVLALLGIVAGSQATATVVHAAVLVKADIPTADVITNIGVVGLAMIGVALAVVGFRFARRMLN